MEEQFRCGGSVDKLSERVHGDHASQMFEKSLTKCLFNYILKEIQFRFRSEVLSSSEFLWHRFDNCPLHTRKHDS